MTDNKSGEILIIEDDKDINDLLATALSKAGYRTRQAWSGTEGELLLKLDREAYALVLLDLMLPGLSGEELLARIRQMDASLPVIILTAKDELDEKINLLILDEPTNHLDIASREWVEAAIEEFEGVLLFVSHDRYFIEKFAERIWLLEDGTIRDFPCGYQKYRSILEHEAAAKPAPTVEVKPKKEKPKGGTKESEKLVRRLEREIEKQEAAIAELDARIEAAAADYQELTRLLGEKETAENALMALMEQWEAAQA